MASPAQAIDNHPALWLASFPWPASDTHKYARGALAVAGGGIETTGAARLVARAGLRVGAGAVTIACDREALPVYAAHLNAIMTRVCEDADSFAQFIAEEKVAAIALGPGLGHGEPARSKILAALKTEKPMVLDADALTEFKNDPDLLFRSLHPRAVLTPHEGEFNALFQTTALDMNSSRAKKAEAASGLSRAVLLLKGEETWIASPDGRLACDRHGTPFLATAGSGDTLTGMIAGLLAQGMPPFEASCAGAWLHGMAAQAFGPGLIAEDLPELLPGLLKTLQAGGMQQ